MQAMEKQFIIRTYGFNELAQLYFPNVTQHSASRQFSHWIYTNSKLLQTLTEMNWRKRLKTFTPKQVNAIINCFDPP
jgi:hypothetical protein